MSHGPPNHARADQAWSLAEAPDVLTVDECARLARTGPKPIYRAIANGEMFGRRIGKQIRVPKRAFMVFCRPDGRPEDPDNVTDRFERAVDRAGLKSIGGPHGLRHTYATLSLEAGVDISVVSKQLGHASVALTARIYAHVTERPRLAAAGKLRAYVLNRDTSEPATAILTVRDRSVTDPNNSDVR